MRLGPDDTSAQWLLLALRIPVPDEGEFDDDPDALADDLVSILNAEWPSRYDIEVAGIWRAATNPEGTP